MHTPSILLLIIQAVRAANLSHEVTVHAAKGSDCSIWNLVANFEYVKTIEIYLKIITSLQIEHISSIHQKFHDKVESLQITQIRRSKDTSRLNGPFYSSTVVLPKEFNSAAQNTTKTTNFRGSDRQRNNAWIRQAFLSSNFYIVNRISILSIVSRFCLFRYRF